MNITVSAYSALVTAGLPIPEGATIVADAQIAAPIDLAEVPAPAPKTDGRNHEARRHNYEARIARRETTALGGLKKAERVALAAILTEELGRRYTQAEWVAAVADLKAGVFTIEF